MKKYAFGVDIGGTTCKIGFFDTNGTLLDKWEIKTNTENNGESILSDVAKAVDNKLAQEAISKDDVQGIGTLTYATRQGAFGALGHGITDTDTGKLLTVSGGMLYDTSILKIVRGQRGTPGELSGMITYSDSHAEGVIRENTSRGIFGHENRILCLPSLNVRL